MNQITAYTPEVRKDRRRWRAYLLVSAALLAVYAIFLGAMWLVLQSPFLKIGRITIEGNEAVASSTVMDILQSRIAGGKFMKAILGFGNILAWPGELAQTELVFAPQIKSLDIHKDYGSATVTVKIEERAPCGIWCSRQKTADAIPADSVSSSTGPNDQRLYSAEGNCWWFDKDGTMFERAIATEGNLILEIDDYSQKDLGLGSSILPREFLGDALSVFQVLRSSNLSIREVRLDDLANQDLEVSTFGGQKLYFSLRFPAANDLVVIQSLLSRGGWDKLQYVDFRVENRAYYK